MNYVIIISTHPVRTCINLICCIFITFAQCIKSSQRLISIPLFRRCISHGRQTFLFDDERRRDGRIHHSLVHIARNYHSGCKPSQKTISCSCHVNNFIVVLRCPICLNPNAFFHFTFHVCTKCTASDDYPACFISPDADFQKLICRQFNRFL